MDVSGAADESVTLRTAKSCGPDAPTLASSSREAKLLEGEGGNKARSPGRARRKPLKPSRAGMPGDSGATVVTNARVFYPPRAAAGASGTRHSPLPAWGSAHALHFGAKDFCTPRAYHVAGMLRCISPSLRAKQSNPLLLLYCLMDCFAEPVIGRAFARPVGSQ
jgi:hypothetical protein